MTQLVKVILCACMVVECILNLLAKLTDRCIHSYYHNYACWAGDIR